MMGYDQLQNSRKTRKRREELWLKLIEFTILFLLFIPFAGGNSDWIQSCSVCHCNWNSGKKTADCKYKSLSVLPVDMSSEMQVIDLSNNMIAELKRNEFLEANFQNLHKLFMRNCTLQELNRDALSGLAILIELDMSHNFIRKLYPGTFNGLAKLRNVVMNHNEIEVLSDRLFESLPYLSRVEFKFNKLKHIESNAFGQLPILSAVYLEANKLSVIRKEIFQKIPKLIYLSLAQNPWNCSCDLLEFRNFTIANRLYTPPTDCFEPPRLRGKLWSEISSDDFACQPRILGSVRSFIEAQSDNITLPCRIEASPDPNITWIFNKRTVNLNDHRIKIFNSFEQNQLFNLQSNIVTSELRIFGVRVNDKGLYTCIADNGGGRAEAEFQLLVGDYVSLSDGMDTSGVTGTSASDTQSNILLIISLIVTTFLLLLIIMVLAICWHCRRLRTYKKDSTMITENGLISAKKEKTHNTSILDGSVIMEMQKSLLTEINPVEKPPRRTELEGIDGDDESREINTTLLESIQFGNPNNHDDEGHSIALSDTIMPRGGRSNYVDDNYGSSLPPDLLAFPARVPTSPSMQSSQSNIPDQFIYGIRSPALASPVYAHMTPHGIYGTTTIAAATPNAFMTLQHPKSRNLALIAAANNRQQLQSPFVPAPVVYSPAITAAVVLKQGYMTIPRKPRIPSWTPSSTSAIHSTQFSELQSPISPNPSETGTAATVEMQSEPVYDNLGLRTTAGGNSILNLHKAQNSESTVRYSMRDRPLPATPSLPSIASKSGISAANQIQQPMGQSTLPISTTNPYLPNNSVSKIYEPILELVNQIHPNSTSETEPLYGTARNHSNLEIVPGTMSSNGGSNVGDSYKISKIPPRPPPKPKKKMSVTSTRCGQSSTSQLFDDEDEDGTEV